MITHHQDEELTMADPIVIICAGWIEQAGPPEEVLSAPIIAVRGELSRRIKFFRGRVTRYESAALAVAIPNRPILHMHTTRAVGGNAVVALQPEAIAFDLCAWTPANPVATGRQLWSGNASTTVLLPAFISSCQTEIRC
jgi:spermidine/putrescine transport system ATP-binding protein